MITERDLQEAIAECQGERNPNSNTCIKLASFYTILDHMSENRAPESLRMSFASGGSIRLNSGTEFAEMANSSDQQRVMEVMDELMQTLKIINPRLYTGVMMRLQD